MKSEELSMYYLLKKFWNNLGMTHNDIQSLPSYTYEILSTIMSLEEQYQQRNLEKGQSTKK